METLHFISANIVVAGTLLGLLTALPNSSLAAVRERVPFNQDWRFIKGDPAAAEGKVSYEILKPALLAAVEGRPISGNPGADVAYAQPGADDSKWRRLNLPHDWGVEGPFDQTFPGETGKLPWWGIAWYRKHFEIPSADAGREIFLEVDGAMSYAFVWLNGRFVGGWPYGYASWRVNLTPHIRIGVENVLAIRIENPPDSSRWYPGGGIYRNVWLVKTSPVHVENVFVSTPGVRSEAATVAAAVTVASPGSNPGLEVSARIYSLDSRGELSSRPVATASRRVSAAGRVDLTANIPKPRLWNIDKPNLYMLRVAVTSGSKVMDEYDATFGVRTLEFSADRGFLLNGEQVPVRGVCNHHDLGALGAAVNARALERQLEILKEMGCNAIRTSHNPPAPELLDLCDRMGFIVMDEAFDCWAKSKKPNDYHLLFPDWHEKDLRALVRRDRNHPSVVLWSIGNEVPEQWGAPGAELAKRLAAIVKEEDSTRSVTAGCNNVNAGYNGFQKALDVFGFNYKPNEYAKFRQANPGQPVHGSETSSCVSSRGEYFFPVSENKAHGRADFQVSSYDLYAPPWAFPPDVEFRGLDEAPFAFGEFVWTGFDYLGEPTPYNADTSNLLNFTDPVEKQRLEQQLKELGKIRVPSRSSYFGIIDLAGFKKDRFYIYQARWRPELPMVHILPHWTWPDRAGQVTPVHVYTSGDEAELFLNGRSLGRKQKGKLEYRLRWDDVTYQPGELKVVAYKQGKRWAQNTMRTAGPAAALHAAVDNSRMAARTDSLAFITVRVVDGSGNLVPRAKDSVKFTVSGPGEIVAVDNGDATSFESFQASERKAYNGMCLAIVRPTGKPGTIMVEATATGLKPARTKIVTR